MNDDSGSLSLAMKDPSWLMDSDIEFCGEGGANIAFMVLNYPIVLRFPKSRELNSKEDGDDFLKTMRKTALSEYIYKLRPFYLHPQIVDRMNKVLEKNRPEAFRLKPLITPVEVDSNNNVYGKWCVSPHSLKHQNGLRELIFELKPKEGIFYNSTQYVATDYCDSLLNTIDEFREVMMNKYPNQGECMFNRRQGDPSIAKFPSKVPLCPISLYNSILDKDFASLKFQITRLIGNGESYFFFKKNTLLPMETDEDRTKMGEIVAEVLLTGNIFEKMYSYESVDILGIKRACLLYKALTEDHLGKYKTIKDGLVDEYVRYCEENSLGYNETANDIEGKYESWLEEVFTTRATALLPLISFEVEHVRRAQCSCVFAVSPSKTISRSSGDKFAPFVKREMNESIPTIVLMQLFLLSKTFVDASFIFTVREKGNEETEMKGMSSLLRPNQLKYSAMVVDGEEYLVNSQLIDLDAKRFTHIKNWRRYIKLE